MVLKRLIWLLVTVIFHATVCSSYEDMTGVYFEESADCPADFSGPFDTAKAYPDTCFSSAYGSYHAFLSLQAIMSESPRAAFHLLGSSSDITLPFLAQNLQTTIVSQLENGSLDPLLRSHWNADLITTLPPNALLAIANDDVLRALFLRDWYLRGTTEPTASLFVSFFQKHDMEVNGHNGSGEKAQAVQRLLIRLRAILQSETRTTVCQEGLQSLPTSVKAILCAEAPPIPMKEISYMPLSPVSTDEPQKATAGPIPGVSDSSSSSTSSAPSRPLWLHILLMPLVASLLP
jgi:hypothetical protein